MKQIINVGNITELGENGETDVYINMKTVSCVREFCYSMGIFIVGMEYPFEFDKDDPLKDVLIEKFKRMHT